MIEIRQVHKSFGDNHVLKDMTLTLSKGTIFGLIGINGAGKSTLLRLLSGVLIPDQGEITYDGLTLNDQMVRKNIFYLSDQPTHSLYMTIKDLSQLYQVFYPFDETLFYAILRQFNLDEKMTLHHISKGMKRQAYLACAFASKAKYLLLDEVFDGLDPVARLKFKKLMIEHSDLDRIFILTSHSLRELEDICDSFGLIDLGHFKKFGQMDHEMEKLTKYQIVLKDKSSFDTSTLPLTMVYTQQEGRILTLVVEGPHPDIQTLIDEDTYHVIDELHMSFEEYFMAYQGGELK